MRDVLKAFGDASHANYGTHSYAAGYLESLVVEMLYHCPKRYQKSLIRSMTAMTERQEQEALAKINKAANTHTG